MNGGRRKWLVAALAMVVASKDLLAAPYGPDGLKTEWVQPDGTVLDLRVFGDEFYARSETRDGYTVVFVEADLAYHYAVRSPDGEGLVSSGFIVGSPLPRGWPKHIRASDEGVRREHARRRRKFVPEESDNWARRVRTARRRRAKAAGKLSSSLTGTSGPSAVADPPQEAAISGSYVGLTVLVQFPDDPTTQEGDPVDFPATRIKMERFCNELGYSDDGNTGSVRDYFLDQSLGTVDYTQIVPEIVTLPNPRDWYNYADHPANANLRDSGESGRLIVQHAIAVLQGRSFDFAPLTRDSNDRVFATNILFAGANSGVWSEGLWPHRWHVSPDIQVGVGGADIYIHDYQITNAQSAALPVGTFIHENGHLLLGYPDLYDQVGDGEGIGHHGVMGSGNYLNGGKTPAPINGYFKYVSGWSAVVDLGVTQFGDTTLASTGNGGYRIRKPGTDTEFFLVENRGAGDPWAANAEDTGILIWHIDETFSHNNFEEMTPTAHYHVSLEQADGQFNLETPPNNRGDSGDCFDSGTSVFDDATTPNARWWDGTTSGIKIAVLDPPGANMAVRFGDQSPETISIHTPDGGETFAKGSTTVVAWSANLAGNVRIDLLKGGALHSVLAADAANDGHFEWTIDENLPVSDDYRIRVSSVANPGIEDSSDGYFALATEIFPSGGVVPAGWVMSAGADAGWAVTTDHTTEGEFSLRSEDIDDSQTAAVELAAHFVAGTVDFDVRVESETYWDFVRFYIDGVEQDLDPGSESTGLSGMVEWTSRSFPVATGMHTFKWVYAKDDSISVEEDTAWIDRVILPPTPLVLYYTATADAGLIGEDAKPESMPFGDGISNLLKYAFNMDLEHPDSHVIEPGGTGGLPNGHIHTEGGLTYWRVEYVRRKDCGLLYTPMKSDTLEAGAFEPMTSPGTPVDIDGTWERVIVDETIDPATDLGFFSRVHLTLPN